MASTTSILGGLSTMVPGDNNGAAKYKRKKSVGEWHEQRRTLAYSELAHLGVDNVMFALRLRRDSDERRVQTTGDPTSRMRRKREAELKSRNAKRKTASAAGAVASGGTEREAGATTGDEDGDCTFFDEPCKNKPCVRRNAFEEKLISRVQQVKVELEAKAQRAYKLKKLVSDREKRCDAVVAEVTSLDEAVAVATSDAEKLRRRELAGDEDKRRTSEELSRLELDLRKLRKRHQDELHQRIPLPTESIVSDAVEWTTFQGEPFTSDGLTVTFSHRHRTHGLRDRGHESNTPPSDGTAAAATGNKSKSATNLHAAGNVGQNIQGKTYHANKNIPGWEAPAWQPPADSTDLGCGSGWAAGCYTRDLPSREHTGRFGRWGTELRDRWSCCLWEEDGNGGGSNMTSNSNNGKCAELVSGGCERVKPRLQPGGMTAADDVRLVIRRTNSDFCCCAAATAAAIRIPLGGQAWPGSCGGGRDGGREKVRRKIPETAGTTSSEASVTSKANPKGVARLQKRSSNGNSNSVNAWETKEPAMAEGNNNASRAAAAAVGEKSRRQATMPTGSSTCGNCGAGKSSSMSKCYGTAWSLVHHCAHASLTTPVKTSTTKAAKTTRPTTTVRPKTATARLTGRAPPLTLTTMATTAPEGGREKSVAAAGESFRDSCRISRTGDRWPSTRAILQPPPPSSRPGSAPQDRIAMMTSKTGNNRGTMYDVAVAASSAAAGVEARSTKQSSSESARAKAGWKRQNCFASSSRLVVGRCGGWPAWQQQQQQQQQEQPQRQQQRQLRSVLSTGSVSVYSKASAEVRREGLRGEEGIK